MSRCARPSVRLLDGPPPPIPIVDLSASSPAERERELARLAGEDARALFDLTAGPLYRARIVQLAHDETALCLVLHHLVTDGLSTLPLVRDLLALYSALAGD